MKLGIAVGSFALAIFISSCSYLPLQAGSKDCGFSASYTVPEPGKSAWISISRVLAEVVNGQTNCGFAYLPTAVDKALVDGKELEVKTIGEDVLYVAPVGFDPATHSFSIDVDGHGYIADPNNVRREGDRYVIGLRPFPPK
jgi:hypothetical protein